MANAQFRQYRATPKSEQRSISAPITGWNTRDDLDNMENTAGFSDLTNRVLSGDRSLSRLTWRGEDAFVLMAPIQSDSPYINWSLGLLVPEEVISTSVRRSALVTALSVLFTILVISGLTLLLIGAITLTAPLLPLHDPEAQNLALGASGPEREQ